MSASATANKVQSYAGHWNVQVVRGKVTTRCLWNACKALTIGLILMFIGTTMSVIGYYADYLSLDSETQGNSTVKIRNEGRGFHLNNLSYAGPIVMGVGGFIVVAACVMTFEARDSAAKIVPARFKPNANSSVKVSTTKSTLNSSKQFQRTESRRNTSCQTPANKRILEHSFSDAANRRALTAAFAQFSQALNETAPFRRESLLSKSPSAPDLTLLKKQSRNRSKRSLQHHSDRNTYLTPSLPRQALSMDYEKITPSRESFELDNGDANGSRTSMVLDLHDCQVPVTIQVRDSSQMRRGDSAKKEYLKRQRAFEEELKRKQSVCCHHPTACHHHHKAFCYRSSSARAVRQRPDKAKRSCSHEERRVVSCHQTPNGSPGKIALRKSSRASCPSPSRSRSMSPRKDRTADES